MAVVSGWCRPMYLVPNVTKSRHGERAASRPFIAADLQVGQPATAWRDPNWRMGCPATVLIGSIRGSCTYTTTAGVDFGHSSEWLERLAEKKAPQLNNLDIVSTHTCTPYVNLHDGRLTSRRASVRAVEERGVLQRGNSQIGRSAVVPALAAELPRAR